jgi:hypothetical protein
MPSRSDDRGDATLDCDEPSCSVSADQHTGQAGPGSAADPVREAADQGCQPGTTDWLGATRRVHSAHLAIPRDKFFVFLGLSGYLFGRECFEVVALRRLDRTTIWSVRQRAVHVPCVGVVRRFDGLRRIEPYFPAS